MSNEKQPRPEWYVYVAERVLMRGYKRTGDRRLLELADRLHNYYDNEDFDKILKRIEEKLWQRQNKRSDSDSETRSARDPLEAVDRALERLFTPLERLIEHLEELP